MYVNVEAATIVIQNSSVGWASGMPLAAACVSTYCLSAANRYDELATLGLIDQQGRDSFFHRIIFPCRDQNRIVSLYGRSTRQPPPHRFLPRAKGGLVAWETLRDAPSVILVEGLFDLAVLWQAGFRNTTSALGCHLTAEQFAQLSDDPGRQVFIAFDSDANAAGQTAALRPAAQLRDAGMESRIVRLPDGHDPNSFFVSGASAADFAQRLEEAR
jgi:DNA primase